MSTVHELWPLYIINLLNYAFVLSHWHNQSVNYTLSLPYLHNQYVNNTLALPHLQNQPVYSQYFNDRLNLSMRHSCVFPLAIVRALISAMWSNCVFIVTVTHTRHNCYPDKTLRLTVGTLQSNPEHTLANKLHIEAHGRCWYRSNACSNLCCSPIVRHWPKNKMYCMIYYVLWNVTYLSMLRLWLCQR